MVVKGELGVKVDPQVSNGRRGEWYDRRKKWR